MGRAGRHIGLRAIREKSPREKPENNPRGKMTTTAPSNHRVPSLTLTLELIPSCCGHPNILLTQPIDAETTTRVEEWEKESKNKNTMMQGCPSHLLSSQDTWAD